jgi:hypothetical protein
MSKQSKPSRGRPRQFQNYTVEITQTGIRKGNVGSFENPIARALHGLGLKDAYVYANGQADINGEFIDLPPRASKWLNRFNEKGRAGVAPFQFNFRLPIAATQPDASEYESF